MSKHFLRATMTVSATMLHNAAEACRSLLLRTRGAPQFLNAISRNASITPAIANLSPRRRNSAALGPRPPGQSHNCHASRRASDCQQCHRIQMITRSVPLRHQTSFSKSLITPIAVTAAPAPAPCTISGLGLYRSVWNMTILSDPPRDVANGCVLGYLFASQIRISASNPAQLVLTFRGRL